jgi:hypothetical protein
MYRMKLKCMVVLHEAQASQKQSSNTVTVTFESTGTDS